MAKTTDFIDRHGPEARRSGAALPTQFFLAPLSPPAIRSKQVVFS